MGNPFVGCLEFVQLDESVYVGGWDKREHFAVSFGKFLPGRNDGNSVFTYYFRRDDGADGRDVSSIGRDDVSPNPAAFHHGAPGCIPDFEGIARNG